MLKKYLSLLVLILFLTSCANQVTQVDQSNFSNKKISIQPIGKIDYESVSNKSGGIFGAIGVLIENAGDSNDKTISILKKDVNESELFNVALKEIKSKLTEQNGLKSVSIQKRILLDKNYDEIKKTNFSINYGSDSNNFDRILEFYIQNLSVNKYINGWYVSGIVKIRIIDSKTHQLLGESYASKYPTTILSDEKIGATEDDSYYSDAINRSFQNLVIELTDEALKKLFNY